MKNKNKNIRDYRWHGVFRRYSKGNLLHSIYKSLILFIFFVIILFFTQLPCIEIVLYLSQLVCQVYPSLVGFTLAAYAIILGINNKQLQQKLTSQLDNNGKTQLMNVLTSFTIVFGSLCLTLIIGVLENLFTFSIQTGNMYFIKIFGSHIYNFLYFFLAFFISYSLMSLFDIVLNIYNLGRLIHKQWSNNNVP